MFKSQILVFQLCLIIFLKIYRIKICTLGSDYDIWANFLLIFLLVLIKFFFNFIFLIHIFDTNIRFLYSYLIISLMFLSGIFLLIEALLRLIKRFFYFFLFLFLVQFLILSVDFWRDIRKGKTIFGCRHNFSFSLLLFSIRLISPDKYC